VHVTGVDIHMLYEAICIIDNNRYKGCNTAGRACRLRKRSGVQELTPQENSLNTEQQRECGQ
jgi:hypothetical protein